MGTAMHSRTEQLPNDSVSDSGSTIAVPVPMTMSMTRFTCLRRIMYAVIALFLIKGIQASPWAGQLSVTVRVPASVPVGVSARLHCDMSTLSGAPVSLGRSPSAVPVIYSLLWYRLRDQSSSSTILFMYEDQHPSVNPEMTQQLTAGWTAAGHWLDITAVTIADYGVYTCIVNDKNSSKSLLMVYEPPQNMTLAVASSVTENTKMSLECTVHAANPAPSILWCVGAEPCTLCTETDVTRAAGRYSVTARRTVTLQRTADNSPVTVTCRAANPRNVSDTWRAERAMIDVQYVPVTDVAPVDPASLPVVGQPYSLECRTINANPLAVRRYQWKAGTLSMNSSKRFFAIDRLLLSSDAVYQCKATNNAGYGEYSAGYRLHVHTAPVLRPIGTLQPVDEGATVRLPCDVKQVYPPNITAVTWSRNGSLLPPDGVIYLYNTSVHASLEIRGVSYVRDAGSYRCSVTNEIGTTLSDPISLDVYSAPLGAATVVAPASKVIAGQQMALRCEAPTLAGFPAARRFTWLKEAAGVVTHLSEHEDSLFVFSPQSVVDGGMFACVAANELGHSERSQWASVGVEAPAFIESPRKVNGDQVIIVGKNDLHLTCLASGNNGHIQILWWHDGQELDVARFRSDVMSESRSAPYAHGETVGRRSELLWTPGASGCALRRSYSGRYVCRAEATLAGQLTHDLSATLHVDVQYAAQWIATSEATSAAPGDSDVILACNVCANPAPSFHWTLNGQPLPASVTANGSQLHIAHVTGGDFGNYTCVVTNTVNRKECSRSFQVPFYEKGPPHAPADFRAESAHSTSCSLLLRWRPVSDGGYPPLVYHLEYRAGGAGAWLRAGVGRPGRGRQLTLLELRANTMYTLRLWAENQRPLADGTHNSSDMVYTQSRTLERPRIELDVVTFKSDSLFVSWTYSRDDAGERRRRSAPRPSVGVVLHYQYGAESALTYPTTAPHHQIPASERQVTVHGNFSSRMVYKVWLAVYEGSLLSPTFRSPVGLHRVTLTAGGRNNDLLIGGLVSSATLIILLLVGFVCFLRCRHQGCLKSSEVELSSLRQPLDYLSLNTAPAQTPPPNYPTPDICSSLEKRSRQQNNLNQIEAETSSPLLASEKDELATRVSPYENMESACKWRPLPASDSAAHNGNPPPDAPSGDATELVYADLSFEQQRASAAAMVHGTQDTVDYTTIDFAAMAANKAQQPGANH